MTASIEPRNGPISPALIIGIIGIILLIGTAAFFVLSGHLLPAVLQNNTGNSTDTGIQPVDGKCTEGLTLCSGTCVDLRTDLANCGACGFSVPFGESCVNGQFSSSLVTATTAGSRPLTTIAGGKLTPCTSGRTSCSGICRDLQNDDANCGSCGDSCPSGQDCRDGRCVLPGSTATVTSTSAPVTLVIEMTCSGRQSLCGNSCVDLLSDKKNCGVCGRSCGSEEICVNARCGPACTESGTTLCDENCVDLDTDPENCGACGIECESFLPNSKGSECAYGKCIISGCKSNYADCNDLVSDGCEVHLSLDAANCGSCGKKCTSGKVCYNSKCIDPASK